MNGIPDTHRDLLESPYTILATVGPDGRPQLSAVWFLAEEDQIKVSLNTTRQKVRNLRRNLACTVFILDLANPLRYLEIRGDARLIPDDDYEFRRPARRQVRHRRPHPRSAGPDPGPGRCRASSGQRGRPERMTSPIRCGRAARQPSAFSPLSVGLTGERAS